MALNPFVIKRNAATIMSALLPTIAFYVGIVFYNLWIALGLLLIFMLLMMFTSKLLLSNPFTNMLEGKGLLVFNIDSTGMIRPFLMSVASPFIKGRFGKRDINDVWDRESTMQMSPVEKKAGLVISEGKMQITLNEAQYNKARFQMNHFPVLIWNDQLKTFLTKDYFSSLEKDAFAQHLMLYLNRVVEILTHATRDFARHVVDTLRPDKQWYQNKWIMIVIIIFVGILLIMLAPAIMNAVGGLSTPVVAEATKTATSSIQTPLG